MAELVETLLSSTACEEAVAMLREGRAFRDVVHLSHFAEPSSSAALLSLGSRIDSMRFASPATPLTFQLRTGDETELRVELPPLDSHEDARLTASDSPVATRAVPTASPAPAARGSPAVRTPAAHTPSTRAAGKRPVSATRTHTAAQKRRRRSLA